MAATVRRKRGYARTSMETVLALLGVDTFGELATIAADRARWREAVKLVVSREEKRVGAQLSTRRAKEAAAGRRAWGQADDLSMNELLEGRLRRFHQRHTK